MGNCLLKEQKIILGAIIFTLKGRYVFLQAKVRLVSVKKLLNWLIKLKITSPKVSIFCLFKTKENKTKPKTDLEFKSILYLTALKIEIKWRVKVRWNQL